MQVIHYKCRSILASAVVDIFVGIDRHIEDTSSKFAGNILWNVPPSKVFSRIIQNLIKSLLRGRSPNGTLYYWTCDSTI